VRPTGKENKLFLKRHTTHPEKEFDVFVSVVKHKNEK